MTLSTWILAIVCVAGLLFIHELLYELRRVRRLSRRPVKLTFGDSDA